MRNHEPSPLRPGPHLFTDHAMTPEIAIMGHPNEGKSSVLSTLAEDDSVRISPTPGETTQCRTFPVVIDGREVLRFTDTPGFQNPGRVLSILRSMSGESTDIIRQFRDYARNIADLRDDRELLLPAERGAGIIYVVDGSRPVRNVDREEMEILRLTGRPRMAIINCKDQEEHYLHLWKDEFRKSFNANRVFNAHRATYAERILLLQALQSIDQDWQQVIAAVIAAFKDDWAARNKAAVGHIITMLRDCLQYRLTVDTGEDETDGRRQEELVRRFNQALADLEIKTHQQIRLLFKHHIFNYQLPPRSILAEDLFNERTWQLLGLSKKQLAILGGLSGAAVGVGLDAAHAGLSMGFYAALGGAIGAIGAIIGGESISNNATFMGIKLGGQKLQIGPASSIDLLFVLLNRALLFYLHTINWAHGRRDYKKTPTTDIPDQFGFTRSWPVARIRICNEYFKALRQDSQAGLLQPESDLREMLETVLMEISERD
jgi:GTP-binding protein EngB required for normal cell division